MPQQATQYMPQWFHSLVTLLMFIAAGATVLALGSVFLIPFDRMGWKKRRAFHRVVIMIVCAGFTVATYAYLGTQTRMSDQQQQETDQQMNAELQEGQ